MLYMKREHPLKNRSKRADWTVEPLKNSPRDLLIERLTIAIELAANLGTDELAAARRASERFIR
jgi:hypothetical protein